MHALQKWSCVDLVWPRPAYHVEAGDDDVHITQFFFLDLRAPVTVEMEANHEFLYRQGAQVFQGLDAFTAASGLQEKYSIKPHMVSMVIWGSSHPEDASSFRNGPNLVPSPAFKVAAFHMLCQQFRQSAVLILYAGSGLADVKIPAVTSNRIYLKMKAHLESQPDCKSYTPQHSLGSTCPPW